MPSSAVATTERRCPSSSAIRAGRPARTSTDLASTFPSTQRPGWSSKSLASQPFPWALPAAQTNTVRSLAPPWASAAIVPGRRLRSSSSLNCSMIPGWLRLRFTKSRERPSLDQSITVSNRTFHRSSMRPRPSGVIGWYRSPAEPVGMANIAMSAPHATPRAASTSAVNASLGLATITPATAVPWERSEPSSSFASGKKCSVTVLPANTGCPASIPVSIAPSVMPLPGSVPAPCASSICAQARSARTAPRPHWFRKRASEWWVSSRRWRRPSYSSASMHPKSAV